jgi:hypothetical protein
MKNRVNREGAKSAKKENILKRIGLKQENFAVLRGLRVFAVKEVCL